MTKTNYRDSEYCTNDAKSDPRTAPALVIIIAALVIGLRGVGLRGRCLESSREEARIGFKESVSRRDARCNVLL